MSESKEEENLESKTGKGYLARDKGAKGEEDAGLIEFKVIRNDK